MAFIFNNKKLEQHADEVLQKKAADLLLCLTPGAEFFPVISRGHENIFMENFVKLVDIAVA